MQAVNLLPLDARKQTSSFSGLNTLSGVRVIQAGAAVTGAIALLIGVVYYHESSVVSSRQQTLAEVQARVVAVEARAQAIKDAQSQAASRVSVIQSVVSARLNWSAALIDLARVVPVNVHLSSLQATSPAASAAILGAAPPLTTYNTAATTTTGGAQTFSVQGIAPSHDTIALVLDRLASLPWLSQVTLQQTSRQPDGTVQFQVAASLSNEGPQMIKKLDAKLALLLTVVAALVVVLVGWFGLITSERSKASHVDTQIAQQQDQLTAAQTLIATTSKAAAEAQFRAAVKVLPDSPQMSQVVRELSTASATAKTQIDSMVPSAVTTVGAGQAVPITLTIEGQYFAVRHFLALLQAGASMKNEKVVGKGRLYSVDSVQFTQAASSSTASSSQALGSSGASLPHPSNSVTATIAMNVFIAGAPPAPVVTTPTTTTSGATSDDTSTTASGTTP